MQPRILLLNPPVYDFSAYDFWLKPYGLLSVAGRLRGKAELRLFDFLDRFSPYLPPPEKKLRIDAWGRGEFHSRPAERPIEFSSIPRRYMRFGAPREAFRKFLQSEKSFDAVLIQTTMTYWYPGLREVIADLREISARTRIVLGGVYATLCPAHAQSLGADLVVDGLNLDPLWNFLQLEPDHAALPFWDDYTQLETGVQKLADGCPFKCTYCSVPQVYPRFQMRPLERSIAELRNLAHRGVKHIAFYDDALLYQPHRILIPYLKEVLRSGIRVNFHTPNAMNARFISKELAALMVEAGFKIVYLGFESSAYEWQKKTGGKVYSDELARAIENLVAAGADISHIHAYLIMAHPQNEQQNVEASMHYANSLGIRVMLAEFSPIPGTPDGELCRKWVDLDEPLFHNKTAFPYFSLGETEVNRIKQLCRALNARHGQPTARLPVAHTK
ncbi:MAG TPA: B12-binding domain-containing radical SAM protein [Planctomycetota bacterium]|nr:B12-binding domain-containing radical SAM protein [Planctomycetota bacterium]